MRNLAIVAALIALFGAVQAQELGKSARAAKLRAEIAELKKRLADLEGELAVLERGNKPDVELLLGSWKQTNGMMVWTYTFRGKSLTQVSTRGVNMTVAVTFDENAEPRRMTWRGDKIAPTTALYKVQGERLMICWGPAVSSGQWRKLQEGPNVFYMEFDRVR